MLLYTKLIITNYKFFTSQKVAKHYNNSTKGCCVLLFHTVLQKIDGLGAVNDTSVTLSCRRSLVVCWTWSPESGERPFVKILMIRGRRSCSLPSGGSHSILLKLKNNLSVYLFLYYTIVCILGVYVFFLYLEFVQSISIFNKLSVKVY